MTATRGETGKPRLASKKAKFEKAFETIRQEVRLFDRHEDSKEPASGWAPSKSVRPTRANPFDPLGD
jgi:hypothetical protein